MEAAALCRQVHELVLNLPHFLTEETCNKNIATEREKTTLSPSFTILKVRYLLHKNLVFRAKLKEQCQVLPFEFFDGVVQNESFVLVDFLELLSPHCSHVRLLGARKGSLELENGWSAAEKPSTHVLLKNSTYIPNTSTVQVQLIDYLLEHMYC